MVLIGQDGRYSMTQTGLVAGIPLKLRDVAEGMDGANDETPHNGLRTFKEALALNLHARSVTLVLSKGLCCMGHTL